MAKCMDLHSAGAIMQDVKNSVLNQGKILSNGKELKDYQDTMNKILFIENGMIEKDNSCSCHHHHHHEHNCGSSIVSILKTDSKGLIDTYTITYSDGRTSQFQIKNGEVGPEGPPGPRGDLGLRGKPGESVYEIAQRHGFEGDEQDFLDAIYAKVVTAKEDDEHYVVEDDDDNPYVKYVPQTLDEQQKWQARDNIDAFDENLAIIYEPVGIGTKVFDDENPSNVKYTAQSLTPSEQDQARKNIDVASEIRVLNLEKKMAVLDAQGITTVGDISTLIQTLKDTIAAKGQDLLIVNAINVVYEMIDDLLDKVGNLADLTTVDKTNVVAAINELSQLCYEDDDINFNDPIFPWT